MPITPVASQFRAMSVDHSAEVKRNPTPPINEEGQTTWNSTGISASSSEHDNQETNAWSSDYSNSEDEYTILEEGAVPVSQLLNVLYENILIRLNYNAFVTNNSFGSFLNF